MKGPFGTGGGWNEVRFVGATGRCSQTYALLSCARFAAASFCAATSGLSGQMMFFHLTSERFLVRDGGSASGLLGRKVRGPPVIEHDRDGLLVVEAGRVRDLKDAAARADPDAGLQHELVVDARLELGRLALRLELLVDLKRREPSAAVRDASE